MATATSAFKKAATGDKKAKEVLVKIDRVTKNLRRNDEEARVGDVTLHVTREEV